MYAQHGGKLVREDTVAFLVGRATHAGGEIQFHAVSHDLIRKIVQGDTEASSSHECCRDGKGTGELGRVTRFWPGFLLLGLGDGAQDRARDAEFYASDLPDLQPFFAKLDRRVYTGMGEVVGRIRFEEDPAQLPAFSQVSGQRVGVCIVVEVCLQEAEAALEGCGWPG